MPSNDLLPAVLGLIAAISWGTGDFCGGLASKRTTAFGVVIVSQAVGLLLLLALALLLHEPVPSTASLAWGAAAGLMGGLAVTALYMALAGGKMGIAAPITAVLGAALPVLFGVAIQGPPAPLQVAGLFVALVGVALLSLSGGKSAPASRSLGLAVFAGLGIGVFLILLRQAGTTALFWPLVAARVASVTIIFAGTLAARQPWRPGRKLLPVIALAGVMDLG